MLNDDLLQLTIIGDSSAMQQTRERIRRMADYDAPLMVLGETGTGKELVARGVHYCSSRKNAPLIPINCGAFTEDLILSELFGHEKGAFTDAKRSHTGLLECAHKGSVFLDEVDSLSPRAQVALLRFLQEGEFRPIGSEQLKSVDVRIIAASNKNLAELVAQGRFREDLYYRLEVLTIDVPPLRLREQDIQILSEHFLLQLASRYDSNMKTLHADTMDWFARYAWPGNVRELENYLHRVFILSDQDVIRVPEVKGDPLLSEPRPRAIHKPLVKLGSFQDEKDQAVEYFERQYIDKIMQECAGNVSQAARRANKDRRVFGRLLKKYGVDKQHYLGA